MSARADIVSVLSLKDIGKNKTLEGEGVGAYGSIALKRTVDDVTYTLKATDTSFKNLRGLNGCTLTVAKALGPLTATGGLELGPVRRLSAQLKGKFRFEHGRAIELGALWSEKTGAMVLSLVGQPHPNLKLTSTLNSKSQALTSIAEAKHRGFTLAPAINWQSGQKGVALSHRFKAGTLKGSYAFDSQVAGLEYNFKPYKIILSGKTSGPTIGHPTLTLAYEKELELGSRKAITIDRSGSQRVPEVQRDIPLDSKLRELDALYEPKIAKARAEQEKDKPKKWKLFG